MEIKYKTESISIAFLESRIDLAILDIDDNIKEKKHLMFKTLI